MKIKLLVLTLVSSCLSFAHAAYSVSTGVSYTGSATSTIKSNENSKANFKSSGAVGAEGNMHIGLFLGFSLNFGALVKAGSGTSQYNYQIGTNNVEKVEDIDTTYTEGSITGSLRFHLLNTSLIKLYGGYGYGYGEMKIKYDKEKLTESALQKESVSYYYPFMEAGAKILFSKGRGLEVSVKKADFQTSTLATLDNSRINFSNTTFMIMYVAPFSGTAKASSK